MFKKIDSSTLFLSGIILLCFGVLIYHINPYQSLDTDFELRFAFFIDTLFWKPMGLLQVISGVILIWEALRRQPS